MYWTGTSKFKIYLQEGTIHNCPLNPKDSVRSDYIYGPSRTIFQGGMKRRRNQSKRVPRVSLSTYILLHHKNIELYFNFLKYERNACTPYKFIQNKFTHSRKIHFKWLRQHHQRIKQSQPHVQCKRLQHEIFYQDNKFNLNALRYHIRPASLNIHAKLRHIRIINRSIQTIKQGAL